MTLAFPCSLPRCCHTNLWRCHHISIRWPTPWLPPSLPPQVRYEAAAERARRLLEVPDAPPLLHDQDVYIHLPEKARKLMASNAAALKRVAGVLGAKVRDWKEWAGRQLLCGCVWLAGVGRGWLLGWDWCGVSGGVAC